jgi:hypothetical protein
LNCEVMRAGAEHEEVVLRAQGLHVVSQLDSEFIFAHARPRGLEQPL